MNKVLDYEYKDRKPKDTVECIKKFFLNRGFRFKIEELEESEVKTYSCHIKLFYKDKFILFSNGKGATAKLSLASGFGELYERFCNGIKYFTQKNFFHKVKAVNKVNLGYYVHPEERIMSYEEILSEQKIYSFFGEIVGYDEDKLQRFISAITNSEYVGIPYKSILNEDIKYLDPQLIIRIMDSTGMCAGNSFEEAFNEGFSELLERFTYFNLLQEEEGLSEYYVINTDNIQNEKLQECLTAIKEKGYKYYIIDLSYYSGCPVIMGLLINEKDHYSKINFGCFPVFEIALMRTITEMYQNTRELNEKKDLLQIPSEFNYNGSYVLREHKGGLSNVAYIPPWFFDRIQYKDSYNPEVFLKENVSSKEVFEHYKDFIRENKLHVWYIENGLIPEVKSLHIYIDNINDYIPFGCYLENDVNYNKIFNVLGTFMKYEHMMYNEEQDFSDIDIKNDAINVYPSEPSDELAFMCLYTEPIYPLWPSFWTLDNIICDMDNLNDGSLCQKYYFMFIFDDMKKYCTIRRYVNSGYDYEEMSSILKNLGIKDFTMKDYENANDINYLVKKILIEPSWNYFHSKEYAMLCLSMTKK